MTHSCDVNRRVFVTQMRHSKAREQRVSIHQMQGNSILVEHVICVCHSFASLSRRCESAKLTTMIVDISEAMEQRFSIHQKRGNSVLVWRVICMCDSFVCGMTRV